MDWQKYESGDLTQEEMKTAQERLGADPAAAAELEGLKKFRRMVRTACLSEPVPTARLEKQMKQICQGSSRRQAPWWLAAAAPLAAAALLAAFWFSGVFTAPDPNGERAIMALQGPVPFPFIDLQGKASFQKLEVTDREVRYRFRAEGQELVLSRSRPVQHPQGAPVVKLAGREAIEDEGLCWYCPTTSYRLTGGTPELRKAWAAILIKQTGARKLRKTDFVS